MAVWRALGEEGVGAGLGGGWKVEGKGNSPFAFYGDKGHFDCLDREVLSWGRVTGT